MRLDRIHIDGFGRAENVELPLGPGLTLVHGLNGTGKTTIHQFLHAILFRFEKNRFPIVRGGRRGGVIAGVTDDGRAFEVTRHGQPDVGGVGSLDVRIAGVLAKDPGKGLSDITGGIAEDVYEAVFAFGLNELTDFKRLTSDEIANRIYGASIGVASDILAVESELDHELATLWKERGFNPAINIRLGKIETLERDLAARDLPAEYGALRHELAGLKARVLAVDKRMAELKRERDRLDLALMAHPPWATATDAERSLQNLGPGTAIDASVLADEARLAEAVALTETSVAQSREAREVLDTQVAGITLNQPVLDRATDIDTAVRTDGDWRARNADIEDKRRRLAALRRSVDGLLSELSWSAADFRTADVVALRTDAARRAQMDLADPAAAAIQANERAAAEAREVERLERELENLDDAASGLPEADPEVADATDAKLRALAGAQELAADVERRAVAAAAAVPQPRTASPPVTALAGLSALLAVVGIAFFAASLAVIGAALLILALAVGAAAWVVRERGMAPLASGLPDFGAERQMARERVATACAELGLPRTAGPAEIEAVRARVQSLRGIVDQRRNLARDRERASQAMQERQAFAVDANNRLTSAQGAVQAGEDSWRRFLAAGRLPETLNRDGLVSLLGRIESAKKDLHDIDELAEWLDRSDRSRAIWTQSVQRLGKSLGREAQGADEADAPELVEALREDLEEANREAREREQLLRRREEAVAAERVAGQRLELSRKAHAAFLATYDAADREALERRHEDSTDRTALIAKRDQALRTLETMITDPAVRAAILADLPRVDPSEATQSRDMADQEMASLADERTQLLPDVGTANENITRLEREADTSEARQELENQRAALSADAHRWLVTRIARELLRATRAHYEAKHRPAVLRRAEELFDAWTEPEYRGFILESGKGLVGVISREDNRRVLLEGLSRGTSEELYFAMRLSLVEHLATQQESMPLVMDDVLVNFDPIRAERTSRAIEELAKSHQVIYLTCHENVPLRPDRTIELGRDVEVLTLVAG